MLPEPVYQAGGVTVVGMDFHHHLVYAFEPPQVLASAEDGEFAALDIGFE
jgi:hypothetical protein